MKNPQSLRMSVMLLLLFLVFNANHVKAQAEDGLQVPKMAPAPINRGYLQYLPPNYSGTSQSYPCIIFLHGHGAGGNGSPADLDKITGQGPPKFIKSGATMCFAVNGVNECFIVLSPQQAAAKWSWTGDALPFIKWAIANYRIDPDRVYLTGLSMGGGWDTAYDLNNNPNILAGFAPVSTTGDFNSAQRVATNKIPVWAFHGDSDTEFALWQGKSPLNGMIAVGADPAPMWSVVIGGGHNASTWDKTFSPTHTYYNPNMYEWFLANKKGTVGPKPPLAKAGSDKTITLPIDSAKIVGSASDPDGTIATYFWRKVSGPAATLINASTSSLTARSLVAGTYTFRLLVTDNSGYTHFDDMILTVNVPPKANAGPDKSIMLPANSVVINGTGTDSDGTISTYAWTKTSGGAATLTNIATANLTASGLVVGTYVFRLKVTDNKGATHFDEVTVVVNPASNVPPVADAGPDKSITLPTNSTELMGSASDTDGTIASTSWTQISGPNAATLTGSLSTTLTASNLILGTYVFRLTAIDNLGTATSDDVTVTINPAPNVAPVANAGDDKIITLPANSTVLTGSGSDTDGTIATYSWTKISGPAAALAGEATPTLTLNALTEGVYVFQLTVTDNQSAIGIDDVTVTVFSDPIHTPTWINKFNVTEDAVGTLTKIGTTLGGANSQEVLEAGADGWVQVEIDQNERNRTIGLSDVEVDYTPSTIDYGVEFSTARNNVFTWQLGVKTYSHNYVIGDVYRIERLSNTILFKRNGVIFRTASVASTTSLIVDVSMENTAARIYNSKISFGSSNNSPVGRMSSNTSAEEIFKSKVSENGNSLLVYPNPVSTTLFISLDTKIDGPLKVIILDSAGKVEWEGTTRSDSEVISIDLASTKMSTGIKIISIIKSSGEVVHRRLQKID